MRCVVPYCNNDSGRVSKTKGVVFHIFPSIPSMRKAWIQILDKPPDWTPKEGNAICSDHFLPEDLYTTTGGQRRVRVGAVPIIAKSPISNDYSDPENLMVCRICLAIDRKLYSMSSHKLGQAYEHVIGLSLAAEDRLPQKVCIECAMRLSNYFKFKNKGLRANKLMLEILKKEEFLTVNNIQSVDRERNHLIDLNIKAYDPNYADFDVEYKEDKPVLPPVIVKDEIENEIYITENDEDPHRDAVAYSDDDFSSEDSLPLENQRKQRKKIVKKEVVKVRKKQEKKMPAEPKIDRRRKPFLNDHLNETLFTITDLSFEEQIAEIEKRRESSNYKNAVFKCDECFKGFLDEAAYTTHVTRHTDQYGEHECEICKTHFKHPHALRKHITAHHTQRFSCNQCSYVTTHRQTARLHERWHKGTKYHCPHCQDEFVKFTTYMGHIRIKHPSDFICELCGYSFVSAKGIELHKKLKHRLEDAKVPEDGPYCEPCKVRFVSQEAYRRHLNESGRHTVEKDEPSKGRGRRPRQVVIKERNRESEEKRVYPSQMRRAEGPIPCEQCGMQLEDSRAYHGHFRRMHPDKNRTNYPSMKSPCMCEVCGRMFQSYALLKDHTWVHTGERPFKCDSCDKSFRMKQRLVAHRRVHSQLKRTYVCSVCGKHFSTHSNRQRHMIIHMGLKPFKCEMCGKGFKHASEKRAHVTYVHLKKPWPKRTRAKRRLDGRTSQIQPPQSLATSGSEMDMQPIWPPCDPKLNEINTMMDDKPMYYNLKHVI